MENATDKAVGLAGVGRLGLGMARNLMGRGRRVIGYRRSEMNDLIAAGGEAAQSPADLARRSDTVLICVPSGDALASVLDGEAGLLAGLQAGKAVFDLGTYDMGARHEARAKLTAIGAAYFDCAVSGNPSFVAARTASIFVSGDREFFVRHLPVLEDITDNVTFAGAFGAGTALKLIVAALIPVHTLAAAEAMSLASRAGIDRQLLFDAIAGTPASSGMFETRGKAMVSGEHARNITINGYLKNIGMAIDLAGRVGGDYPLLTTMHDVFRAAADAGFGAIDQSAIVDYLMGDSPKG